MIDCHCHLHYPQFKEDREAIIQELAQNNISVINSSVDPGEIPKAKELAGIEGIHWCLGLTASCLETKKVDETIRLVREYRGDIVGVGEVGLDYHWVKKDDERGILRENLKRFLEYTTKKRIPLVVHCRNAEDDVLDLLEEYGKPAMLHSFSGNIQQAERAWSLDCITSIPSSLAYSKPKQRICRQAPLESLVLETDSPYLSPTPGKRNTPLNILETTRLAAEVRKTSFSRLDEAVTLNACKFFSIE